MLKTIKSLVRPFISVSLVSLVVYLGAIGKIDAKDILQMAGIIIAFHFGERASRGDKV